MVQLRLPKNSTVTEGKVFYSRFRSYTRQDVLCLPLFSRRRLQPAHRHLRSGSRNVRPMVFDALIKIKNEVDQTLAFRRSCREAVCVPKT
jgi:succinate dehydrogenase iron-sulfur subunit